MTSGLCGEGSVHLSGVSCGGQDLFRERDGLFADEESGGCGFEEVYGCAKNKGGFPVQMQLRSSG